MTSKIFHKNFGVFFLLLFPLEILSHYPEIDNAHFLRKDIQWILDKVFREKLMD